MIDEIIAKSSIQPPYPVKRAYGPTLESLMIEKRIYKNYSVQDDQTARPYSLFMPLHGTQTPESKGGLDSLIDASSGPLPHEITIQPYYLKTESKKDGQYH